MRRNWKKYREDKSALTEPRCPFCREIFSPPREIPTELSFFTGGTCKCGAVYVYDISSKNLGEAYMDALSYACKEDWDMAMSLEPEKDYNEMFIKYSHNDHTTIPYRGRHGLYDRSGDMIFIKIKSKEGQYHHTTL